MHAQLVHCSRPVVLAEFRSLDEIHLCVFGGGVVVLLGGICVLSCSSPAALEEAAAQRTTLLSEVARRSSAITSAADSARPSTRAGTASCTENGLEGDDEALARRSSLLGSER